MIRAATALLGLALLAGCPPEGDDTDTDTGNTVVYEGPVLVHTPVTTVEAGTPVPVSVQATDDDGVGGVRAYHRTLGEAAWDVLELVEGPDGTWTGTIEGEHVVAPGLQYYFRGQDLSDLQIASYLPEDGQQAPFLVDVPLRGRPVPYVEDFEGLATGTIYGLGWDEAAQAFGGYPWAGNNQRAASGAHAVAHRRGVEGVAALDDWLISPPLDLTSLAEVQVTWEEWGNNTALARHSLWISTGSPDPAAGEFVKVADLAPPPEDAWGPSGVVDLTPWASASLAYLAWRYEGQFADDWWIDDVAVEALGPDVRLEDWTADPAEPGLPTTVTFTIVNASPKASGPFQVSATTDPADAIVEDPFDEGAVDGLPANGTVEVGLVFDVDPTFPDDSLLPFTLTIDQGGDVRSWDLQLVVGTLPTAEIDLTTATLGLVQGWLGVGDPSDPEIEIAAFSEVFSGTRTFSIDLAPYVDQLPPAAGAGRWYLRVSPTPQGSVDGFSIAFQDVVYESADLGSWTAGAERYYYLPRPPKPVVTASSATPSPVVPGATVTWSVTLANQGAATVGLTTAQVTTDDPDVTLLTTTPTELAADGWAAAATATFDVSFEVSAAKTDSEPIRLQVTVTDEVESFVAESTVAVPWPVMHVTGVSFDDVAPGGDDDGVFEPGERSKLVVELTNQGDAVANGVNCVLSQTGGPVTATIHDATGSYGLMGVGATDSATFEIGITGGAPGDTLDFHVACDDQLDRPFGSGFQVVLGEAPWVTLSPLDDAVGDALGGDIDLVNGRYRSDGDTLEIALVSATPFAPATLFFESWMTQQGSEFVLYQLVVQGRTTGPTATVRGCTLYLSGNCYSWGTVTTPTATVHSPTEIRVALDLADMGLVVDRLDAGFGGGFCGGESLYCDHFPEGWGNGVTGLLTYRFLPLDVGATSN